MRLETAGLSRAGGRKTNQDNYGSELGGQGGGCWLVQ